MNEPIKEYNSIKKLVENNDIENVVIKNSKNDMTLIAHKKKVFSHKKEIKPSRIDKHFSIKKYLQQNIYR